MKISVVIPVYNGARFIEKSYHTIINQQLEDFEILYVDNNSTDATVKNINKLQEKDARIKLYHQIKQGAAPTRNKGLINAVGDYVYFFDVDDDIFPDALKKMISVLDEHQDMDAVFGKMVKSQKHIEDTLKPGNETHEVIIKEKPYWGLAWFSDLSIVVGPPAFLYRRSVFKTIGIYNEDLRIGQDTALDIKLGMTCNVAFLDTYIYLYYKHSSSTIEQKKKKTERVFFKWPRLVKEHLPFYLENDVPIQFEKVLFSKLYNVMGKQLYFTKSVSKRQILKRQLIKELEAIKIPLLIQFYLSILVVLPYSNIVKFYGYYVVPYIVKKIK